MQAGSALRFVGIETGTSNQELLPAVRATLEQAQQLGSVSDVPVKSRLSARRPLSLRVRPTETYADGCCEA